MVLPSFLKAPSEDKISYPKESISQPEGNKKSKKIKKAENPRMYTFLESVALEFRREVEEVASYLKWGFLSNISTMWSFCPLSAHLTFQPRVSESSLLERA